MNEVREVLAQVKAVLYKPSGGLSIVGAIVAGIILFLIARALSKWVGRVVTASIEKREKKENTRRIDTLTRILGKLIKYAIYIMAVLIFLDMCNIKTSTVLATAGLGSLAIAMGAQALIKDVINGFFIIFDDQYSVGDYVECAGKKGHVQSLGIRTTVIRDFDGAVHTVPNSEIGIVTNRGRDIKRAKVVVPVDRREDPDRVLALFKDAIEKLDEIYPDVRTDIWGITDFVDHGYEITVVAWERASLQFDLEYDLRKCLIEAMNRENINMPYPRLKRVD
ncbi:MAG: mechanosensitive ion channel family protein [Peptoniphilus sp.]|nr:mechanosensitive ion channel family protein [Peptoniphilus sp.]MDD7362611.1 mechanosensitive ion channel family protein [Bacillota bacterium]MDY6044990.1 mechanosensitive ion channel family protein [Peptoniphilus sp.]